MGVSVSNYHVRSNLYHKQVYFTVLAGYDSESDILYPGYMSGYNPQSLIPITEVNALTEQIPVGADNHSISGTISGFDATTWHTPLHIIATDNTNYAIGCYIYASYKTLLGVENYYFVQCCWNGSDSWVSSSCQFPLTKAAADPALTAYNKLPQYIYMSMIRNDTPANVYYPYPMSGGWYFSYDDGGTTRTVNQTDVGFISYLIPQLNNLHYDVDENPEPQPTPVSNDDPYSPGGSSWTGGGGGSYNSESDDIGLPDLPTLSAASTGFLTLFNPSGAQMRSLAQYMWSGLFDIDTFRKIFADPMQCILGLSIVPVNVPSGGSDTVKVGNIDTGISMTTASSQYTSVACGSVTIDEYWGSYLDYEPYTKIELYLPYCGTHPLNTDDVMGKTVTVTYHVDVLSGACIAYVGINGTVMYSYAGQCSVSIPITGNDWTNVINGALSIAGSIGSMVATGGATAPMAIGQIASTAVNSMKPNVEKSGSLSGGAGLMAIQTPYLIITRPRQALPERQNSFMGYPSFITEQLGNISGYTEVESVHLTGIPGTAAELSEIESLLKSGVIL